jgi:hypothetical protein
MAAERQSFAEWSDVGFNFSRHGVGSQQFQGSDYLADLAEYCKYTPKKLEVRNTQRALLALFSKQERLRSELEALRTVTTVNQSTGSGATEL